ncbi:molybdenum cofactor guanylyltransferase [Paraglaciecola hydrolytica]|uniref:MobA-like NTP transferase domain-containing protein n=1 Tax=Paraglaciecola hydrolytica TaxID=1799789 RepID=A0A148KN74_9ALTE|nr:molybdenum cofactor guanylyltransferase [Paraglaciecola hydrolytica]KXI27731.1 hypothetical protein AX660_19475 [Paraglaciecola hydrolytica]
MANTALIAVVLAGGKSSRMGQDKSMLYSSKLQASLLQQSISLLTQLAHCEVVISSNTYAGGVKDIIPECGPLSGIHAVLNQAGLQPVNGYLFIPVDMPKLSLRLLESLLLFGEQQQCAAYANNSFLPCYLPVDHHKQNKLLTVLNQQLQSKDWSVRRLLAHLGARSMPWQDDEQLVNINNPQDWQQHCV